jgi:hypothetical protein
VTPAQRELLRDRELKDLACRIGMYLSEQDGPREYRAEELAALSHNTVSAETVWAHVAQLAARDYCRVGVSEGAKGLGGRGKGKVIAWLNPGNNSGVSASPVREDENPGNDSGDSAGNPGVDPDVSENLGINSEVLPGRDPESPHHDSLSDASAVPAEGERGETIEGGEREAVRLVVDQEPAPATPPELLALEMEGGAGGGRPTKRPEPCPADFTPTEEHVALAASLGLDLAAEVERYRAKGRKSKHHHEAFGRQLAKAAGRKTRCPDVIPLNDTHRRIADEEGVELERERVKMITYHQGKGTEWERWDLALCNWLREAGDRQRRFGGGNLRAMNQGGGYGGTGRGSFGGGSTGQVATADGEGVVFRGGYRRTAGS